MLRPYHADDVVPWQHPAGGQQVSLLALGGTLMVAGAALFSPLLPSADTATWRWGVGSACLIAAFVTVVLTIVFAQRSVRRWHNAAVEAQHQLLLPQMLTMADASTLAITAAVTAPLATPSAATLVSAARSTSEIPSTATDPTDNATGDLDRRRSRTHVSTSAPASANLPILYDPLTGAITHSALMTRLEADIAFALAHERPLALAVFDLDHFRTINTLYSYSFGDEVLFAVAERLRSRLSDDALLARLGADRFAVVWSGTHFPHARALIEDIITTMSRESLTIAHAPGEPGERVRISLRAGLALCPDDGRSAAALLELAEYALAQGGAMNPLREDAPALDALPPWHAEPPLDSQPSGTEPTALSYLDAMLAKNGSIQALASAMEARDVEGIDHARNLAELAQETALLLGRSIEESRLVGLAALLHDVGNLGIPAEILEKSEPLSTEEWAFVREHPHLGERLLTSVGGVLAAIAPIIAAQRERWDGSGYPLGTQGESIPLGARIVAVCDVYGALVSERPYRPAFTHDEALSEIKRYAGTQFDPTVVAAFVASATA